MNRLSTAHRERLRTWGPAFIAAGLAWLLLIVVGETPLARATGLALAVLGVTASMRPMGFVASMAGGVTLALCPVFWSQTGGAVTESLSIVIASAVAVMVMGAAALLLKRSDLGIGLGIFAFVAIFWSQTGTAQSLRITGLVTSWLLYLLVDMILLTNPRPGFKPAQSPKRWHLSGLLFLFAIGTINDPLVTLLAPAILLALFLSYAKLPAWYWLAYVFAIGLGLFLLRANYLFPGNTTIDLWGWREAGRWIELVELVIGQFSIFGIVLGVIGLARLSRWYPPLGTVTIIAYAAYIFFGLVYSGAHRGVLLMPLIIIQVMWMTYAFNTFGQWVNKSLANDRGTWIHIVSAFYFHVPVFLLANILQS